MKRRISWRDSPEDVVDYDREEVVRRMLKCLGVEDEEMDFTGKHRGLPGFLKAAALIAKHKQELAILFLQLSLSL
ncbi:hypothetical protein P3S68_029429 [Capsicum galapagoense]